MPRQQRSGRRFDVGLWLFMTFAGLLTLGWIGSTAVQAYKQDAPWPFLVFLVCAVVGMVGYIGFLAWWQFWRPRP